ncbi:ankyrin repeat ph and sec7 domain containing protein secg-related [Anaeramoeba flamelloides]|uniref:Ankyrin repeat ph and sec7 domain containing protein secg-related n=1 Tax=Anaeramoeba flamelloides TaxID=1746091 RepID=A0AAV7Z1R2_9EUKA|nr:ankyrin repeat ph and sec7 domain containing protein secg-related [Anaeramoeba flamelloides]
MDFWNKKKNRLTLTKAPKNVVIDFIKNNCDENPGLPIVELLLRKKYEQFWIKFGMDHKGSLSKISTKGHSCLEVLLKHSKIEESYEDIELIQIRGEGSRQDMTPFSLLLLKEQDEDIALWKLFLQNGSNPLLRLGNNEGNLLSLMLSKRTLPKISTLKLLTEHGYPLTRQPGDGPLLSLLCNKNLNQDFLEYMLQIGAEMNPKFKSVNIFNYDFYQQQFILETPLCQSIIHNHLPNIKLFLKNGADPNLKSAGGNAPLHNALIYGSLNLDLLKLLVEYGADLNLKNKYGLTLLTLLIVQHYYNFFPEEKKKHGVKYIRLYLLGWIRNYHQLLK